MITYIREYNVTHGVPKAQAYNTTMYIMAGLLVIGFLANLCVKASTSVTPRSPKPKPNSSRRALNPWQGVRKSCPAEHKEAIVKTSSQTETSSLQLLLNWAAGPYLAHDGRPSSRNIAPLRSQPTSPSTATPQAYEAHHAERPRPPEPHRCNSYWPAALPASRCSPASRKPWSTP